LKAISLLRNGFHNLRIKNKLLFSYGLLILVTVVSISYISYQKTSRMMEEKVVESTNRSFEQAATFLSYKLNNVKDVSSMLFMNGELRKILSKEGAGYSLGEQLDDYNTLQEIVRSAQTGREIYSIRLYVNNSAIYGRENSTFLNLADITGADWYSEMMDNQDGIYCRSTYSYHFRDARGEKQLISCVRTLHVDGFNGKILGVLSIDMLESSISEIMRQTDITRNGQVYLVDKTGTVISGLDQTKYGQKPAVLNEYPDLFERDAGKIHVGKKGQSSILIHKKVEGTNWQLVALIPEKEIAEQSRLLAKDLFWVLLIVFLLAVWTAVWISEGITRRIQLLLQQIRKIEDEKWDVRHAVDSADEVGVLQAHFYRMSETMRRLIQEKYQDEVQKKSAELKALQAQINPHFLYNTLDMIHWLAMKHRAPEISDVVGRLAKFFRLSLSEGRDIITIREELDHVRTYLDIQNKRFGGTIEQRYEIETGLENFLTVKLILQPIVENSVLHGIQEREDKQGTIRIAVSREGELLKIVVEDDGVGMSTQQAERLARREAGGGYGVQNVIDKIKLHYGDEYGLEFESEPGKGTRVTVRIPAVLPEPEADDRPSAGGEAS
jgi:two-component system sensor histidine kinase YesM